MNKQPTGEQWSVSFQPEEVGLLNRRRAGGQAGGTMDIQIPLVRWRVEDTVVKNPARDCKLLVS